MIELDGSFGEAGGQIVRTALALSVITRQPFKVTNIRLGRDKPGLKAQHIAGINVLKKICNAVTSNVEVGSKELEFIPDKIMSGDYNVDIGTAGSISLLLQSLFLPCMFASDKISLNVVGGTSALWQPPVSYTQKVLLPYLQRFAKLDLQIKKRGYFPKGGGLVSLKVEPRFTLYNINAVPYKLIKSGSLKSVKGISHASVNLKSFHVAERQAEAVKHQFKDAKITIQYQETSSTGSGVILWATYQNSVVGANSLGKRGKFSEAVGREAADNLKRELGHPVDRYLSDQLLPFMALLPGSKIKVSELTSHAKTNMWVIEKFLPIKFRVKDNVIESLLA